MRSTPAWIACAICSYLDDVAKGGHSLFGTTPEERATTNMWTRRIDLEICNPFIAWWRGGEDAASYYRGNRVPAPEARHSNRLQANQGFNQLDDDLEGRAFIAGDRLTMADIMLFAFMATMMQAIPWLNPPGRTNVASWYERMAARDTAKKMMEPFSSRVSV